MPAQIAQNLQQIRQRIADAAARCGRRAEEITLVGVTKYVAADAARALVATGCADLGESRPQQLWERADLLADLPVRWHFIGHLQRNKVRRTLPLTHLIHSVDSPRLAAAIEEEANLLGRRVPVLLEVNVSGEAAKHGLPPGDVEPLLTVLAGCRGLEVHGLMCMAALEGGPSVAQRDFAAVRALRDRLRANCPEAIGLAELSMGMSSDFEAAIAEGATIVRIGSALFEGTG